MMAGRYAHAKQFMRMNRKIKFLRTRLGRLIRDIRRKGGQFILHAEALPGNPHDGHTLKDIIEETETLTEREIERAYVDKGYRGHDATNPWQVFKSGQKRGVHWQIKKKPRRRSAIEPVIEHCKPDGHLDRNFLKGRLGEQINAVMSAVGCDLRLILKWLRKLLRQIIAAIWKAITPLSAFKLASQQRTTSQGKGTYHAPNLNRLMSHEPIQKGQFM